MYSKIFLVLLLSLAVSCTEKEVEDKQKGVVKKMKTQKSPQLSEKSPQLSEALKLEPPTYKIAEGYKNIKTLFFTERRLPRFEMSVLIKLGSRHEPHDQKGLMALLERMLNAGSKTHQDGLFLRYQESLGADFSLSSYHNSTRLTCSGLSQYQKQALSMCLSPLTDPHFSQAIFDREKQRLVQALTVSKTKPSRVMDVSWRTWYYGKEHPYGVFATVSSIEKLTLEDLKSFFFEEITLDKFSISFVTPDVSEAPLLSYLEKELKTMEENWNQILQAQKKLQKKTLASKKPQAKKRSRARASLETSSSPSQSQPHILLVSTDVSRPQVSLKFGHEIWSHDLSPSDEDKVGIQTLDQYLSGGLNALLGRKIREEAGLTYNISSAFQMEPNFYKQSSHFFIQTNTEVEKVPEMIKKTLETLSQAKKDGVDEKSFQTARNQLFMSLASQFENLYSFAQVSLKIESGMTFFDDKKILYNYADYVNNLNHQKLTGLLRSYIQPKRMKILIYGPSRLESILRANFKPEEMKLEVKTLSDFSF